mmetsp:Transcript_8381/g.19734  ORF Transcript_8381/g.19734 Transcript_8381/m.19734 type:complete len:219 (-) Transcript_8381:835-1491(-)
MRRAQLLFKFFIFAMRSDSELFLVSTVACGGAISAASSSSSKQMPQSLLSGSAAAGVSSAFTGLVSPSASGRQKLSGNGSPLFTLLYSHSFCLCLHKFEVQSGLAPIGYVGKKSPKALYPRKGETVPKRSKYFNVACAKKPAVMPIVVGSDAAQTPSRFMLFSSSPVATTAGGAHSKQAVLPGTIVCMCPETAFSDTPDSSHVCDVSKHAWFRVILAA